MECLETQNLHSIYGKRKDIFTGKLLGGNKFPKEETN